MPAVIIFFSGDETTVLISKLDPAEVAQKIADKFEGYSSDNETTRVEETNQPELPSGKHLTVVLSNVNADDGSGPDHDLAWVLQFGQEEVAWALKQNPNVEYQAETLQDAGALG